MSDFECWQEDPDTDYGWVRCHDHGRRIDITAGGRWIAMSPQTAEKLGAHLSAGLQSNDLVAGLRATIALLKRTKQHPKECICADCKILGLNHEGKGNG